MFLSTLSTCLCALFSPIHWCHNGRILIYYLPSHSRQKPPNIYLHVSLSTGTMDPKNFKKHCWLWQMGISMISSMRENQRDYPLMYYLRLLVFYMTLWSKGNTKNNWALTSQQAYWMRTLLWPALNLSRLKENEEMSLANFNLWTTNNCYIMFFLSTVSSEFLMICSTFTRANEMDLEIDNFNVK